MVLALTLLVFFLPPPPQKLRYIGTKDVDKMCVPHPRKCQDLTGTPIITITNTYHAIPWTCRIPHDARSTPSGIRNGPCNYPPSSVVLRSMLTMHNGALHAMQTGVLTFAFEVAYFGTSG